MSEPELTPELVQTAASWAESLAYFKARTVAGISPAAIVIGADTVVTHGDKIIGKAGDETEARQILKLKGLDQVAF